MTSSEEKAQRLLRWCSLVGISTSQIAQGIAASSASASSRAPSASSCTGHEGGDKAEPVLSQILLDVPRSCHFEACRAWSPEKRAAHLCSLRHVLATVFPSHAQHAFPFYVQGAHDVAAVLLLATGEVGAVLLLQYMVQGPLRGFLQPTLSVPSALLSGLTTLLSHSTTGGHTLAAHIEQVVGVHSIWALPCLLTWYAHSTPSLPVCMALYAGSLGRHPLRPLYIFASLLTSKEEYAQEIVAEREEGMLMMTLQRLPSRLPVEDVAALLAAADRLELCYPPLLYLASLQSEHLQTVQREWPQLCEAALCWSPSQIPLPPASLPLATPRLSPPLSLLLWHMSHVPLLAGLKGKLLAVLLRVPSSPWWYMGTACLVLACLAILLGLAWLGG